MPEDNPDLFNQRLSQWVASQGFWFQVRHSMSSGGSRGAVMTHLLRLLLRIGLVVLVLGLVGAYYIFRMSTRPEFARRMQTDIGASLGCEQLKMSGIKRMHGELVIRRLAALGGPKTFFSAMEAKTVKVQMGFMDALPGNWRLGVIHVEEMDMALNAGADDDVAAEQLGKVVFQDFPRLEFDTIDVSKGTLRWGFSDRTRGMIERSHVRFHRVPRGWRVQATGGEFTQGWLRGLEITDLSVLCTSEKLVFEKAEFRKKGGLVRMEGLKITAGARPAVSGMVKVIGMPIEDIVPPAAAEFVEGSLTGEFVLGGSTNNEDGLIMDAKITVNKRNPVKLRDRMPLLRALSAFSVYHNFRMVEFTTGSFRIHTQRGGMKLTQVDLRADDLMTLAGEMIVRLPTRDEAAAAVHAADGVTGPTTGMSGILANRGTAGSPSGGSSEQAMDITLKRAGEAARKAKEANKVGSGGEITLDESTEFFDWVAQSFADRTRQALAIEEESRALRYEGGFVITLPAGVFPETTPLRKLFPVDAETGRVPMKVPISGDLFNLTAPQAEDLYQRGRKQ